MPVTYTTYTDRDAIETTREKGNGTTQRILWNARKPRKG
jgi:hypothetical protein